MRRLVTVVLLALVVLSCGGGGDESSATPGSTTTTTEQPLPTAGPEPGPLDVSSPSFEDGSDVPVRFTCDGSDISPALEISGVPSPATTLALIVDDPDAPTGTWTHWVVYDIPVEGPDLTVSEETGPEGTRGVNSWNVTGYGGPCPPEGERHRYTFEVFALDTELRIPEGVNSSELRSSIEGHILDQARLMAFYER